MADDTTTGTSSLAVIEVHLEDASGTKYDVYRLKGKEEISRMYDFWVDASVPVSVDADSLVGSELDIVFTRSEEEVRRIPGVVAEMEDSFDEGRGTYRLSFRIVPRIFRLTLRETCDVYVTAALDDILKDLLGGIDLQESDDFVLKLSVKYPQREFVVQYKESDLAFASRLAEHMGVSFYFDVKDGHDVVVFTDDNTGFLNATSPVSLQYHGTGVETGVYALGTKTKVIPKHFVVRDYNYRTPTVDLEEDATLPVGDARDVVEYGTHFKTPSEGKYMAQIRAQERLAQRKVYTGKSHVPEIRAGAFYTIENHPRGDIPLLVTAVEHEATFERAPDGTKSRPRYESTFHAIDQATTYRPPRTTPKPKVHGIITGTIDAEQTSTYADLDDQGRYAVRFVFDTSDNAAGHASHRIRMVQSHTGAGYGMHFPLRPGVEVVLTCIDGDPDRPIIAGTVPNAQTQSPVTSGNNARNVIRTGGGNEFNIDDTSGSERIKLSTPKSNTTFQLGAPNDAEQGAILNTVGASTTVAQLGIGSVSALTADINLLKAVKNAGDISTVAQKPDAFAKGMAVLGTIDGFSSFVSSALSIATAAAQAELAADQAQQQKDADTVTADQSTLAASQAKLDDDYATYFNSLTLAQQNTPPVYTQGYVVLAPGSGTVAAVDAAANAGTAASPAPYGATTDGSSTTLYFAPGDLVFTSGSYRFVNTTGGTLAAYDTTASLVVTVQAELAGSDYNVASLSSATAAASAGSGIVSSLTVSTSDVPASYTTLENGWISQSGSGDAFVAAYAAYKAARAAYLAAVNQRDTDNDAFLQVYRQNSGTTLPASADGTVATYTATGFTAQGKLDASQYEAALTVQTDEANVTSTLAAIDGSEPAYFDALSQLQKAATGRSGVPASFAADLAADAKNPGPLTTYDADVKTASASRRTANDLSYSLQNDSSWQAVSEAQAAATAEKAIFSLFSVAYSIYTLLKTTEDRFHAAGAWGTLGQAVAAAKPHTFENADVVHNMISGMTSPLNTLGSTDHTAVYAEKRMLMWAPVIGIHAPAKATVAEVTALETAAHAAEQDLAVKKQAYGHFGIGATAQAKTEYLAAKQLAEVSRAAADAAKALQKTVDAQLEKGVLTLSGDGLLSASSKKDLELASGDALWLNAQGKVHFHIGEQKVPSAPSTFNSASTFSIDAGGTVKIISVEDSVRVEALKKTASFHGGDTSVIGDKTASVSGGTWGLLADVTADSLKVGNNSTPFPNLTFTAAKTTLATAATTSVELSVDSIELTAPKEIALTSDDKAGIMAQTVTVTGLTGITMSAAKVSISGDGPVDIGGAIIKIG